MAASQPDWMGVTVLHQLARQGNVELARQFLDRGADIHARDDDLNSTPLGWAAKYGQTEMVVFLLATRRAASAPARSSLGHSKSLGHVRRQHAAIVDLLEQQPT